MDIIEKFEEKFTSGNDVPVTMARISLDEFNDLKDFINSAVSRERKNYTTMIKQLIYKNCIESGMSKQSSMIRAEQSSNRLVETLSNKGQ